MEIAICTNQIAGGWHPSDLDKFLGGNEESVVLLARAFADAGHDVEVYTSLRGKEDADASGVMWCQRESFDERHPYDAFISWKDRAIWTLPLGARVKIHASQDVEPPFRTGALRQMDWITTLGTYHAERNPWIPKDKTRSIPLGVDPAEYCVQEAKEHLAIYATSPDRGLETLLRDWAEIRAHDPNLGLIITYDWTRMATMSGPNGQTYARRLQEMCEQDGITRALYDRAGITAAFRRAKYYMHPIINPDSDLYGFGAMKAQSCGCLLVLNTLDTGFRDMAREWIPYHAFVKGERTAQANPRFCRPPIAWAEVVANHWLPLIEGREVPNAA